MTDPKLNLILRKEVSYVAINFGEKQNVMWPAQKRCDYHTYSQCAQYPYKKFCKPHAEWVFYDLSYTYTTVRVWHRSYYTSTRRSRVRVLITMISYEYTWYNWLVPCQKTDFSKYLLYFAKQDWYTLLEQSVSLSNRLFY